MLTLLFLSTLVSASLATPYVMPGGKIISFTVTEPMTWVDAVKACESRGAKIAEIMDEHFQKAAEEFLLAADPTGENHFWIGNTDLRHEGQWEWFVSNVPVKYTNWKGSEPNNAANIQHFGVIGSLTVWQRQWFDHECTLKFHGLCQKDV